MPVVYQTNLATADNQELTNGHLEQIKTAVQLLAGTTEPAELTVLGQILTQLASQATAEKQDTGNTALASILAAMATAANQQVANDKLTAIDNKLAGGSTGALSSVPQATTSAVALAANPNRKGFYLYNNTGQRAFVTFGPTSSSTAFTLALAGNSGYESPQARVYTGPISVVWGSTQGSGNLQVTEIT